MIMRRVIKSLQKLLAPRRSIDDDKFDYAIKVILKHEGGLTNNKNDKGGQTAFGISSRFLRQNKINLDVTMLTKEQAIAIYRTYFWEKYHYNDLEDKNVATKVFDISVNMGPDDAARILQEAIVAIRPSSTFLVDGIVGIKTIIQANQINPDQLMKKMRELQKEQYENIVFDDPTQKVFLKGWLKRAEW